MLRFNGPGRARCLLGSLVLLSLGAHAQDPPLASSYEAEYFKRLQSYQTIQPYGETPFGESIDLATGQVTFTQTDIVLEGSGPAIRVSRSRSATGWDPAALDAPPAQVLGDWTLNLPRIATLVARPRYVEGSAPGDNWRMAKEIDDNTRKRCANFGHVYMGQSGIPLEEWWHGYELVMDDGATQPLLQRDPAWTAKPATGTWPIVTLSDVQIGCLASTSNGQAGDAFLAIAPDGTKYWFDWLVGTDGGPVTKNGDIIGTSASPDAPSTSEPSDPNAPLPESETEASPDVVSGGSFLQLQDRMQVALLVSRVEDRFGNFLTYTYLGANDHRPSAITASDGRKVSFSWNGNQLAAVTAQPDTPADARTWQYQYGGGRLIAVVLPDGSRWTYDLKRTGEGTDSDMFANSCTKRYNANAPASDAEVSTITAPSGLVGTFTMRHRWHARSYANSACMWPSGGTSYEANPPLFENLSLVQRTLSGPGVSAQAWSYNYGPAQASANRDACAATQACPDTSYVDVTEPGGARTRYTHSTRDGVMEGKLVRTEVYESTGALLRTDTTQYPTLASLPFQSRLGDAVGRERSNTAKMEHRYPMVSRWTIQQGRAFQWAVPMTCGAASNQWCFDAFGRVTRSVKTSEEMP